MLKEEGAARQRGRVLETKSTSKAAAERTPAAGGVFRRLGQATIHSQQTVVGRSFRLLGERPFHSFLSHFSRRYVGL